jgi:hypothetical protein
MITTVRNACISGDLTTAEELLAEEIDADGNNYRSYANRSVVMARKLDWDHALDDATKVTSATWSTMTPLQLADFDVAIVPQHSAFVDGLYF